MIYYLTKLIITAFVIVIVSEVAKKSTYIAAIIISIPLTSILAFTWLYVDTKDYQKKDLRLEYKSLCALIKPFKRLLYSLYITV